MTYNTAMSAFGSMFPPRTRNGTNPAHWPRYCRVHAPALNDTAAPAHASHGFEPDNQLGEITSMKWADGRPTWSLLSHSVDLGPSQTASVVSNAIDAWRAATDGALDPIQLTENLASADIIIQFKTEKDEPTFHQHPQIIGDAYYPGARSSEHLPNFITFNDSYYFVTPESDLAGKVPPRSSLHNDEYQNLKTMILRNVCMHEFGHAIGLPHSKDCPSCVMAPYYNGVLDLDGNDIARVRAIYCPPSSEKSPQAPPS